jgi:hypothetical protein
MGFIPHEFSISGVYFPPLFIAWLLGFIAALFSAKMLNKYNLSQHFFYTPLVFVALNIIYTVIISTFVIPG